MKFRQRSLWVVCLLLVAAGVAYYRYAGPASNEDEPSLLLAQPHSRSQPGVAHARVLQMPLGFEPNRGQADQRFDFVARGPGYSLFLKASEAAFSLIVPSAKGTESTVVRLSLIGADRTPTGQGQDRQPGVSRYLTGERSMQVERFGKVRYRGVYPGIDVVYYGNQRELEYDFIVAAGADPGRIGLRFGGANAVKLDAAGNLVLSTAGGDVVQHKPIAYQEIDGERRAVESRYRLQVDHSVAFDVGAYDRAHALVIDPVVVYRAPYGGNAWDDTTNIAVDADGSAYVTGYTRSTDFATTPGAPQEGPAGRDDVFVAKINAAGDAFEWNTYLGGSYDDRAEGIAVDAEGNVVVVGSTESHDFPVVAAQQPSPAGGGDAFVARFSTDGALTYSSYFGSPGLDVAGDVAVDSKGGIYITGMTYSKLFPVTSYSYCLGLMGIEGNHGCYFVTKLTPEGMLVYSIADGLGSGTNIVVDRTGAAYYHANTRVIKLAPNGVVEYRKNVDGDAQIYNITGIAVDDDGAAYVLGRVRQNGLAINSDLTADTGNMVCKIDPAGTSYEFCARVGVVPQDLWRPLTAIAVDAEGGVVVTGTSSLTLGADLYRDAFVQAITPSGRSQRFSALAGRTLVELNSQSGSDVAVDAAGNIFVTGQGSGVNYSASGFVVRMTPADWKIVGAGDMDADGRADLFWHNRGLEQFHTWSMDGTTRTAVYDASIPLQYRVAARADFNGDGRTDVLWYDERKTSVWLWQAEADGTFSAHFIAEHPPAGWGIAGAGDIDGDGRADILWHNRRMEALDWWLMDGAALRFVGSQYVPSQYGVAQVADFNGDGRVDLVWEDDDRTTLWLWQADASDFAVHFIDSYPPAGWKIVGAGDVDGDGQADVLWHNARQQQLDWWRMQGAARIGIGSKFVPAMYRVDATGDFDGDRRTDIVWRDNDRTTLWLWRAMPDDFAIEFLMTHPASSP